MRKLGANSAAYALVALISVRQKLVDPIGADACMRSASSCHPAYLSSTSALPW